MTILRLSYASTMLVEYNTTWLQGVPFRQIEGIKELVLNARIVVKTTNVEISRRCFAEDDADSSKVSSCRRGCESSLDMSRPIGWRIVGGSVSSFAYIYYRRSRKPWSLKHENYQAILRNSLSP